MLARVFKIGLLLLIFFSACEDDQLNQAAQLIGHWEVVAAYRNGAPTESLDGLFYTFSADGQLRTNMTGTEADYRYELDDTELFQQEGPLEVTYQVEIFAADTLILLTELRRKHFRFVLQRAVPAVDSTMVQPSE